MPSETSQSQHENDINLDQPNKYWWYPIGKEFKELITKHPSKLENDLAIELANKYQVSLGTINEAINLFMRQNPVNLEKIDRHIQLKLYNYQLKEYYQNQTDDNIIQLISLGSTVGLSHSAIINDILNIVKSQKPIVKHRNKIRFFISNILIFIGLTLFLSYFHIRGIGTNDPMELSVGIILLINGVILLIKSARKYFTIE